METLTPFHQNPLLDVQLKNQQGFTEMNDCRGKPEFGNFEMNGKFSRIVMQISFRERNIKKFNEKYPINFNCIN